jgi:hypothetical protein
MSFDFGEVLRSDERESRETNCAMCDVRMREALQ